MATRLRHIAIIVPDPEKAATFFERAFGMTRAGTARRGVYMSDGVMNVALLKDRGRRKARPLPFRHVGRRSRRGGEEGQAKPAAPISPAGRPQPCPFTRRNIATPTASCSISPTPAGAARSRKWSRPRAKRFRRNNFYLRHGSAEARSTKNQAPSPSSVGKAATIPSSIARHSRSARSTATSAAARDCTRSA